MIILDDLAGAWPMLSPHTTEGLLADIAAGGLAGTTQAARRVPCSLRFWQGAGDGGVLRVRDREVMIANPRPQIQR
jgi:hypothetical protein